jgi:hypothetical protein
MNPGRLISLVLLADLLWAADAFWQYQPPSAGANTSPVGKTGFRFIEGYTLNPLENSYLQPGVAWPRPRFRDNNNGTVTDIASGLVWLKNANAFGTRTWSQALSDCAALASGMAGLSDGSTVGQWRLPNRNEAASLIDYSQLNPCITQGHPFESVQVVRYWTSTTSAGNTTRAWNISSAGGGVYAAGKASLYHVWPVRTGYSSNIAFPVPVTGSGNLAGYTNNGLEDGTTRFGMPWPNPRYTDNGNGTITDNLTNLVWLKDANAFGQLTWTDAMAACSGVASGQYGLTDGSTPGQWRLPNHRELSSLTSAGYASPALSNTAGNAQWTSGAPFVSVQLSKYWSSASYMLTTAWTVNFTLGEQGADSRTNIYYVWPIRSSP